MAPCVDLMNFLIIIESLVTFLHLGLCKKVIYMVYIDFYNRRTVGRQRLKTSLFNLFTTTRLIVTGSGIRV